MSSTLHDIISPDFLNSNEQGNPYFMKSSAYMRNGGLDPFGFIQTTDVLSLFPITNARPKWEIELIPGGSIMFESSKWKCKREAEKHGCDVN
jgi:hypothetical protein